MKHGRNGNRVSNPEVLGEICPSATLPIENSTWTDWSLKLDVRCEMLATERLSSSIATISRVKDNKIKFFLYLKK
jgi:hypothetical protein